MNIANNCVLFWGGDDIYSNFYMHQFEYDGIRWQCSEQAFMAEKAKFFNDFETYEKIINMDIDDPNFPLSCKQLGRAIKSYDDHEWRQVRQLAMFKVLLAKFADAKLKAELLATGDMMIIEASPFDRIWGIGFDEYKSLTAPKIKWGENLLGIVIMQIREVFKQGK